MSSANSKILIAGTLVLVAAAMYFAATKFSTQVEQSDPMGDFLALPGDANTASGEDSSTQVAPVDVMLVGLRQRLEKQPNNADGWVLLSKSYYHLKRWQEAEEAFEKAKALGYVGRWQPLPRIDAFSRNAASAQGLGSAIEFRDYRRAQAAAPSTGEKGSHEAVGLKLKVSLDPALQSEIAAASPVFIFVRAAENPGPPLAVVRKIIEELPLELSLDDSHAMIPGKSISSAGNIVVGARISVSGSTQRWPGDYEKISEAIPADFNETIELVIKEKI